MKEYEITIHVPQEDKPAEDDGRWMNIPCTFVMGAIVMMLVMLP